MRIGILTESFGGGGAERQAAIWARLCAEWGHELTAITVKETANSVALPQMRVVSVPKARAADLGSIAWRLRKLRGEVDALIAFEPYLGFCCALAHLDRPWMLVTGKVPQQLLSDSRLPRRVYRWAFDRAAVVAAPSRGMIEAHREIGLRPTKPWTLIPNVAQSDAYLESTSEREGVLFVGRLAAVKNPLLAVESAAAVPAPLTMLAGKGELWPEVERAVAARNGKPSVEILRFTGEPWGTYARHRVLVVTSRFESFGNVIIESLAAGTPVVSVDCDFGPREIIGAASFSHLVEPSVKAISEALSTVIDRPYGKAEEAECRAIADRYRAEAVAPLIADAVERLRRATAL
jgi:glycosyltransferase involved in cell wall biosynthesis